MARYTERAEKTARMLDVNLQTSLLPQSESSAELLWRGILGICELQPQYEARFPALAPRDVLDFMAGDPSNPSSIHSCLQSAREKARRLRGPLTTQGWGSIKSTSPQLQGPRRRRKTQPPQ